MSIDVACKRCGKLLERPGALIISPPDGERALKWHVCTRPTCWPRLWDWAHGEGLKP